MLYDPIEGQGHGGLKIPKTANFKIYLLCRYACSQNTDGELGCYKKSTGSPVLGLFIIGSVVREFVAPLELHLTTSELWFGQEQEGILP